MVGFADFLGPTNPFQQWVASNRGKLAQVGAGLASGQNFASGLAAGARGMPVGQQVDSAYATQQREEAERQQQLNETVRWMQEKGWDDLVGAAQAGQMDIAWSEALRRMQPGAGDNLMSVGGHIYDTNSGQWISPPESAANRQNISLTPQWAQDEQGNWHMLQTSSTGELIQSQVPQGLTLADPRGMAMERSLGTKLGGAAGEAMAAAPGDIAAGQTALGIIEQIKTHPELGWATGMSAGLGGNAVPGTGRFGFQNLVDQAKSGAFLTAVQEMRGLGALSNAEGQAATQAITRLNTALSKEDFLRALADYETIVRRGMERAQARLAGSIPGVSAPGGMGTTSGGLQWSIEP